MRSLLPIAALLPLCAGCADYHAARQDVALAHDEDSDTLVLEIVSRGVRPTRDHPERLRIAAERFRSVADGARYVLIFDMPFVLDLDKLEVEENVVEDPAERARIQALVAAIEVDRSGAFVDEAGLPGLYQRMRVPEARACVAMVNRALNHALLDAAPQLRAGDALDGLDRATQLGFLQHAEAGGSWLYLDHGALVVRMPLSAEGAAAALRGITEEGASLPDAAQFYAGFFSGLSALHLEDGFLILRYQPDERGRIAWTFERERTEKDVPGEPLARTLRSALEASGLELETLTADNVRERLK